MQQINNLVLGFVTCVLVNLFSMGIVFAVQDAMGEQESNSDGKQESMQVRIESDDHQVNVKIGDELFTTLVLNKYGKPIFYPVYGPGQIGMTRNWPMREGVPEESHDHPHHKSIWFSHEINGVDFWSEQEGTVVTSIVEPKTVQRNSFLTRSNWIRKDNGNTVLSDETKYQFGFDETSRWIDATYIFRATHGEVTFDDTKEGSFAVRTHPDLRLTPAPQQGSQNVHGHARNSNGESGKAIWGMAARWVLYYGPIDEIPMSIAIFDHPDNLRHPATWHARDYGLVAANPFGLHYFQGVEKGAGAYTIKQDEELRLRYRVVFIKGIATVEEINQRFAAFAAPTTRE